MLRTASIAVWTIAATIGALFFSMHQSDDSHTEAKTPILGAAEEFETKFIAVPVFSDGKVAGYFVAKVGYSITGGGYDAIPVPIDAVIRHAVHKVIYRYPDDDYGEPASIETDKIASEILTDINARANAAIIQTVELREVDYLPRTEN